MPEDILPAPVVANPLAAMKDAAGAANALYEVRKQKAVEALGDAYRGAISPGGEFDPNKLRALASQDPNTAMAIGEGLRNTQQISSDQLEQNFKKYKFLQDRSAALLLKAQRGEPITDDDITGAVHDGVSGGILTMPEAMRGLSTLGGANQATRVDRLKQLHDSALTAGQQYEQRFGSVEGVSTGAGTQFVAKPAPGTPQGQMPFVPSTLSPEQRTQMVNVTRPDGSKEPITIDEYYRRIGQGIPVGEATLVAPAKPPAGSPAAPPGGQAATPGGPAAMPGGPTGPRTSGPAATSPNIPLKNAPPPAPGGTGTGLTSEQSPAASESQRVTGKTSGERFAAAADTGLAAQQQNATLDTMLSDARQFTSGSQAEKRLDAKRFFQTWTPDSWINAFGLSGGAAEMARKIAAQEDFTKLSAFLSLQQGSATDHRMDIIQHATPHAGLSPEGLETIVRQLQGNNDYNRALSALAADYPDKSDYNKFLKDHRWLDPRVFHLQRMVDKDGNPDTAQQKRYLDTLREKDRREINDNIGRMRDRHVID